MPRRTRSAKPYIVVFCEGESEQAYAPKFLDRSFLICDTRCLRLNHHF